MISDNAPNRAGTIIAGALAVAGLAVALTVYARDFTGTDWIVTAFGAIGIALAASFPLPIRGLRMRRSGLTAEAVFMDLSIGAPIFALGGAVGPVAASLAFGIGFGAAAMIRRTNAVTDLTRHGALRVLTCLAFIPLFSEMTLLRTAPSWQSTLTYLAVLGVVFMVFLLAISAPASAVTYQISLQRVWERQVRDPRTWIVGVGSIIWATAVRDPMLGGHYYVAIAMWIPVAVTALLLRTIDEQHAELHRLRLVRDAVQAMLGDRDPLPQINAILATLRVPSYDETVSVLAATSTRTENWRTVTTLGPQLSSAGAFSRA